MSTEVQTEPAISAEPQPQAVSAPALVDDGDPVVEANVRAEAYAAARAMEITQTEAYTAVATERGIQCQKAHELVDLWFFGDWDAEKFRRWAVLTGSDELPSLPKLLAVFGLLLGGMTPPEPPPAG